jgi:hypothetical protein
MMFIPSSTRIITNIQTRAEKYNSLKMFLGAINTIYWYIHIFKFVSQVKLVNLKRICSKIILINHHLLFQCDNKEGYC